MNYLILLFQRHQYLPSNGCGRDCHKADVWDVLMVVLSIVIIGLLYVFVIINDNDNLSDSQKAND